MLLEDIRQAATLILDATGNRLPDEYRTDALLRAAVERWFITIGEALSRLEKTDLAVVQQISDYRKIIGFRNVLVHGYDAIDDLIIWETIRRYLPVLQQEVERLLAACQAP